MFSPPLLYVVHVSMCVHVHACTLGGQKSTLSVCLNSFLRQGLSTNLEFTNWPGLLASELQGSASPELGFQISTPVPGFQRVLWI